MKIVLAVAVIFVACKFPDIEAELSIVTYDVECPIADREYFRDIEVYIENEGKDNEFFINFTLIKSLPADATQNLKMIGASMGEFVVPTGIDVTINLCEAMSEPIFGKRIHSALGMDDSKCPAPPGVYGASHVNFIDEETLPNTFKANAYQMALSILYKGRILYLCNTLFKIQ